jgi:hypothetical protein
LNDPLPLLLQLLELVEQALTLGLSILGIANPHGATLLGFKRSRSQRGPHGIDPTQDLREKLLRWQPGNALVNGSEMAAYFVKLGLEAPPRCICFRLTLQGLCLRAEPG